MEFAVNDEKPTAEPLGATGIVGYALSPAAHPVQWPRCDVEHSDGLSLPPCDVRFSAISTTLIRNAIPTIAPDGCDA